MECGCPACGLWCKVHTRSHQCQRKRWRCAVKLKCAYTGGITTPHRRTNTQVATANRNDKHAVGCGRTDDCGIRDLSLSRDKLSLQECGIIVALLSLQCH